jgi:hypothetical protein
MHPALQVVLVWIGLVAVALTLWPRRPYLAAVAWIVVYPVALLVLWHDPRPEWVVLSTGCWVHIVRSLDAAASNRGLSRGAYLRYVIYPLEVPESEQLENPPPRTELGLRILRGLILLGVGHQLVVLGYRVEPWQIHPYLDDLWITLELAVMATALFDLAYAIPVGLWAIPAPSLHDPTFFVSRSLREFWGKRWNRVFGGSLRRAVFLPLGGRHRLVLAVLATFFVSGLVHGLPFAFASTNRGLCAILGLAAVLCFVLHGLGALLEGALPQRVRHRMGRALLFGVWAITIPLFPGTAGPCIRHHNRPLHDATILHVVPGLAGATGASDDGPSSNGAALRTYARAGSKSPREAAGLMARHWTPPQQAGKVAPRSLEEGPRARGAAPR